MTRKVKVYYEIGKVFGFAQLISMKVRDMFRMYKQRMEAELNENRHI